MFGKFGDNSLCAGYRNELRRAYRLARGEGVAELTGNNVVQGEAARPTPDNVPLHTPTPAKPIDLPYPPLGSLFKGRDDFLSNYQRHQRRRAHRDHLQRALWSRRHRQDAGSSRIHLGT